MAKLPPWEYWAAPAGDHGSCIRQNKYPVRDDEYNYHDSLQAHLTIRHAEQGIVVVVFITINIQSKVTNTTTMIHCRHISV